VSAGINLHSHGIDQRPSWCINDLQYFVQYFVLSLSMRDEVMSCHTFQLKDILKVCNSTSYYKLLERSSLSKEKVRRLVQFKTGACLYLDQQNIHYHDFF